MTVAMPGWRKARIGALCATFSGGTPSTARPEYYGGDIAWIASTDLNRGRITAVSGRITNLGLKNSSARLVEPRTPLIALYGATAGVAAITEIQGAINQAVLAMVPRAIDTESIDTEYLFQWLKANRTAIIGKYTQGGQPNLSGAIVRRIELPVPILTEQSQIAEVLTDSDHQIALLERVVAKKEAIRQGAMQQLLTGKTRLPGFIEPWQEVLLGDVVSYIKTVALSRAQLNANSPLRYLHYGDIHTSRAAVLDAARTVIPRTPVALAKTATRLQVGDLVLVDASEDRIGVGKSVEIVSVPEGGVVAGLHTIAARFDKDVLADGFKAYLQFIPAFRNALLRLAAGTKVLATTRSHISGVVLSLPDIDEQRAIAGALGDCDMEIEMLRARLSKAKSIKRGIMQELLTGRTRLPVMEEAAP